MDFPEDCPEGMRLLKVRGCTFRPFHTHRIKIYLLSLFLYDFDLLSISPFFLVTLIAAIQDEERLATLDELERARLALLQSLASLPFVIDTPTLESRKANLEVKPEARSSTTGPAAIVARPS